MIIVLSLIIIIDLISVYNHGKEIKSCYKEIERLNKLLDSKDEEINNLNKVIKNKRKINYEV